MGRLARRGSLITRSAAPRPWPNAGIYGSRACCRLGEIDCKNDGPIFSSAGGFEARELKRIATEAGLEGTFRFMVLGWVSLATEAPP